MADKLIADDFLRKLVKAWRAKIDIAQQAKKPWSDVRDQCMMFVAGGSSDFWADDYQNKFLGTTVPTRFKISMNKAFELLAVMGPVVFARNPVRDVYPYEPIEIEIEALGDPNDPQVQMLHQQMSQQSRMDAARNRVRCSLLERYLNYTPVEQPDGGLQEAAEDGVADALIGGLGLLWPDVYTMPGSDRKLTGCFPGPSTELLVDPDVRTMAFGQARWVARKHVDPVWEVERRWKLPDDTLKNHIWRESASAQGERSAHDMGNMEHARGNTHDLVEWWEIWSVGGVGCRMSGVDDSLKTAFDQHVGDYAYLAITAGEFPQPLNCPLEALRTETREEIQARFRWPIPFWQDRRWPFSALRFYKHPDQLYPIAPLAPGLGELTFLNFLLSRTANHIWQSSRQFVAVVESARKEVEKVLERGKDLAVFPIKDVHKNISQLVNFLEYPNVSTDIWTIATAVMDLFDRRVGLTDLMYGISRVASRTATDVQAKEEKVSIRPDYMAHRVETWLSEASAMEKLCAYWGGVDGQDVSPLLGATGGQLWDQLFVNASPEVMAREMYCQVAASSARKRNRATELQSLREFYGPLSQQLGAYAADTTDTGPLNDLNNKFFDAMNYDGSGLEMGPWQPPPPPPEADPQALAQAEQQAEMELEAQKTQAELAFESQKTESELELKEEAHTQEIEHRDETHDQELALKEEAAELDNRLKIALAHSQARIDRLKAKSQPKPAKKKP